MRVDVLQLGFADDDPIERRREAVRALVAERAGSDLVVLPELWPQGGFTYDRWAREAEPLDGPTLETVAAAARVSGAHVHGGSFVERADDGRLFNTSLLVGPDGSLLATYRKVHLFGFSEGEPALMTAGDTLVCVATDLGVVGLATCYDLRFPELFRGLVDCGAEVVLVPAAWPAARVEHWSLLARARAVENQCVVVAANAAGTQAGKAMGGRSVVVDARGEVVAEAGADPGDLVATLDLEQTRAWRARFPVLADRVPWLAVPAGEPFVTAGATGEV